MSPDHRDTQGDTSSVINCPVCRAIMWNGGVCRKCHPLPPPPPKPAAIPEEEAPRPKPRGRPDRGHQHT